MSTTIPAPPAELTRFWPAVLACFMVAVFGWGFGFTGTSVYLAELQRLHGWPNALVAAAITTYYLLGALCLTQVHIALRRLGPARLLGAGMLLLGLGATLFGRSQRPWHMFIAAMFMAVGWAGCTSTAISTSLALYFQRQRGLAITLALNGASVAGFTIAPLLAAISQITGVGAAVPLVAIAGLAVVLPLVGIGFASPVQAEPANQPAPAAQRGLLATWRFWSIALPFALALAAQVGLIVHLVSLLRPALGPSGSAAALALTSIAAVTGRLGLATVIDRLPQRAAAAASFTSQAGGVALLLAFPHQPAALYAGCVIFGLSVGNVITYPALIVQREFPSSLFGVVVGLSTAFGQFTFALAPALLGLIRDLAASYAPVLALCITLQLIAAVLVLRQRR